ncbi:hypothetical protein ABZ114_02625 [Streptomyces albidoflavus]|uniref:hypothetical protein n=1 Tax=Streptomyces TaxID=1883 RepID=UPI0013BAA5C1|nr:hypothetical protein [Streptomyces sp. SID8014]NEC14226.1 hypothetical protein [Streptomyces sp. SID8014]
METDNLDALAHFLLTRTIPRPELSTNIDFLMRGFHGWMLDNGYSGKPTRDEVVSALANVGYGRKGARVHGFRTLNYDEPSLVRVTGDPVKAFLGLKTRRERAGDGIPLEVLGNVYRGWALSHRQPSLTDEDLSARLADAGYRARIVRGRTHIAALGLVPLKIGK